MSIRSILKLSWKKLRHEGKYKMYCENCGKEISDNSLYCEYCGTNMNNSDEDSETKPHLMRNLVLLILVLFGILIVIVILVLTLISVKKHTGSDATEVIGSVSGEVEEELSNNLVLEQGHKLLVAVPTEYSNVRSEPGLEKQIISEIPPGTYLIWDGNDHEVDSAIFYYVEIPDLDIEGYVNADFCTPVQYQFDEKQLEIVDTTTSLYTYEMMEDDLEEISGKYSDYMKYEILGTSEDSRNIYCVEIGNCNADNKIFVQAGIHGREYMTSQLIMKMIEYYCCCYESGTYNDISYKELLDNTSIRIIVMSNPDGITISQKGIDSLNNDEFKKIVDDCYQRDKATFVYQEDSNGDMNWYDFYQHPDYKPTTNYEDREITFEEYQTIWKANANGVDLNNNFDAAWNEIQLKDVPAYGSYRGDVPVSEPETTILTKEAQNFLYSYYLSYHAKGGIVYYDTKGNAPANSLKSLELAENIQNIAKYEPVNTSLASNVNMGGFGDWIQQVLNRPSITIEIGKHPCPLEINEFESIWLRNRETWAALCYTLYE